MVKKILIIMFATIMLTVTNCFATNIMNEEFITKDNIEYIKRSYSVPMDQEDDFLVNLENEFKIENKTYQIQDKNRTGTRAQGRRSLPLPLRIKTKKIAPQITCKTTFYIMAY